MSRLPRLVLALVVALSGAASADAAISIEEFVKDRKKWPSQVGLRQAIEGRYAVTGRTLLRFHNCPLDFRSSEPLPKLVRRSPRDVNVLVIGRIRRDGRTLYFRIERITKQEDDLKQFDRRRPTGPKSRPADWFELADWSSGRGRFYKDVELQEKSTEANRTGIALARRRAAGDAKLLREVARIVVTRAIGNRLQRAIEHEALRVELKSVGDKPAALSVVRDRIVQGWPGAEDAKNRADRSLAGRYRKDPVAVYNAADEDDRRRLHRVLYADLAIRLIIAESREAGTSGYKVAELIRRQVPEASAEASQFERMALDADLERATEMGRSELDRMVARLRDAKRAVDADRAVDRWLDIRRERLLTQGVAGRLRLADLVLSLKNDRSTAVSMLLEADRLKPDVPEVAERLGQLGYAKQGKKWVQVRKDRPTAPRRVAMPTGVRVGMSGKQLMAAMGTPRRVSRLAAKRVISEIWVYGDPGGSRIAVHLIRSRGDGTAAVRDISQLPSRR